MLDRQRKLHTYFSSLLLFWSIKHVLTVILQSAYKWMLENHVYSFMIAARNLVWYIMAISLRAVWPPHIREIMCLMFSTHSFKWFVMFAVFSCSTHTTRGAVPQVFGAVLYRSSSRRHETCSWVTTAEMVYSTCEDQHIHWNSVCGFDQIGELSGKPNRMQVANRVAQGYLTISQKMLSFYYMQNSDLKSAL